MKQRTIQKRVECKGVGLHSGKTVHLALRPATEDTGIVFHVSGEQGVRTISPSPEVVIATGLATTLGKDGVSVSTVEHLLAALRGLGVDNVHVDVEGGEVPILDGSAAPFVELLDTAGVIVQNRVRKVLRISRPIRFCDGTKSIEAEPYDGFSVDYVIDFPHPSIGRQRLRLDLTPDTFSEVAACRTFGFLRDVEALKERGLALGGGLENAIVLDEKGVINPEGLRVKDEFVRHKLLDFIGDMAMLPLALQGRFTVSCSGHSLNNQFLRHAMESGVLEEVMLLPEFAIPVLPGKSRLEEIRTHARAS